jgi:hypothetical protein
VLKKHVVEFLVRVPVLGKCIAKHDVAHVLPLYEHVGLADCIGLWIQFLTEHGQSRLRIMFGQIFACHRQHAAGARTRLIDGSHHTRLRQHVIIFDKE